MEQQTYFEIGVLALAIIMALYVVLAHTLHMAEHGVFKDKKFLFWLNRVAKIMTFSKKDCVTLNKTP
jgi:hypothetical protein